MTGQTPFTGYYTRIEILEKLGISNNRFYTLLKNGKIREIPNPGNSRKRSLYYAEDVDKLKNEMELYSKFIMITELAKELDINKARIKRISQLLKIDYISVQDSIVGKGERILFSQENADNLRHYFKTEEASTLVSKTKFSDTSAFYDKELNIALFQLFYSPRTADQSQRLIKQKGKWGFIEPGNKEFIPCEYAMSHLGYFKEYEVNIQSSISETSPLSSQLQFELNVLNEEEMLILDTLYQISGVNNLRLEAHPLIENHIYVYAVKDTIMLEENILDQLDLPLWQSVLKRGFLELHGNELFLISPVKRTTVLFELPTHNQITARLESSNKTVNDFIIEAVEHYLKYKSGEAANEKN